MMTRVTRFLFCTLIVITLSGCQTTTSVDSKYSGFFSSFDSAPEKTKKLIDRGEFEDAANIYQEHEESFDNPESEAIAEELKSNIIFKLRESIREMKSVGQPGHFKSDNRKMAEAKSLTHSYNDYKKVLGFEIEASELKVLLQKASEKTTEILRNEARHYVFNGVKPTYARISSFRDARMGSDLHAILEATCVGLSPSESSVATAVRCLYAGGRDFLADNSDQNLNLSVSVWSVFSGLKQIDDFTKHFVPKLSLGEINDLFRFYGMALELDRKLLKEPISSVQIEDVNKIAVLFQRTSLEEKLETKQEFSRFHLRTDQLLNPEYDRAQMNHQSAIRNQEQCERNYYAQAASNPYAINLCWLHAPLIARARNILSSTSRYKKEKIYEPYQFTVDEAEVDINWRVIVAALDQTGEQKAVTFDISTSESFKFERGRHPKDVDNPSYIYDSEEDVNEFVSEKPDIEFSSLYAQILSSEAVQMASIEDTDVNINLAESLAESVDEYSSPEDDAILNDSIVIVSNKGGQGTGFYIRENFIITNNHVVGNVSIAKLRNRSGETATGVVLAKDRNRDLALLVVTDMSGTPIKIKEGRPETGEDVRAYGHPQNYEFSVTRGIVSAVRNLKMPDSVAGQEASYVQSDVAVSPGNSGGPLIQKGKVIGVITFKDALTSSEGLSFSLSSAELIEWLDSLQVENL